MYVNVNDDEKVKEIDEEQEADEEETNARNSIK